MLVRCLAWRAVKVSLSIGRNHNGVAQVGKVFESWDRALSLMHVSRHLALKPQLRTGKNRGAQRVRLNLRLLEWGMYAWRFIQVQFPRQNATYASRHTASYSDDDIRVSIAGGIMHMTCMTPAAIANLGRGMECGRLQGAGSGAKRSLGRTIRGLESEGLQHARNC